MPNLDPLKFAVELLDIEQSKIDAAWSKVERAFENRTLKIKVDGEKGAVQDSESLAGALRDVSENLKAVRQLLSQGGFKSIGDEAQKAAVQMEGLAKSMQQVNDGIVKSEAWQNYIKTLEGAAAVMKQVNDTASKTSSGDGGLRAQLASLAQATKEMEVINQRIKELEGAKRFVGDGGFKSAELDAYLTRLRDIHAELAKIVRGDGLHPTLTIPHTTTPMRTRDLLNDKAYQELQKSIQGTLKDIRAYEKSERDTAAVARQLAAEQGRTAHAINQVTEAGHRQSQMLGDLKQMAFQYLSVWGAQQFLHNIIETGGLLEQQRLSMGAILQDAEKADEIFGQIKALAVKSPFGVVQLDQMSKQLAAYGFEANELYEWTKRLADISAATGTDVSRLALALGHVRSEGALSGYTLRQFSMGNVPLLRSLSENRGVSTKEIRDLVRKKDITDKEVMDVLKQLTDKGGMFFEAQEVMSGALNAKFKNLRDAFDIMYGEIAESGVGDFLKSIAKALTDGAKEWKRYGTDIVSVVMVLAAMKAATYVNSAALGQQSSATLKAAMASKRQEVANLRLIQSYRELTAEEQYALASKTRLSSADWALLLSTKKLTYEDLKRAVALKRISLSEAERAVSLANLRNAQLQLNAAELQGVSVMNTWQRVGFTFRSVMNSMRSAVAGFMRTFWPLLAIGAIVDLFSRHSQQQDEAGDMGESMVSSLLKKQNELTKLRNSLEENRPQSNEELQSAIKSVTDALKANGKYTDELRLQVDGTQQLTDKYRILKTELNSVTAEYEHQFETIKMGMQMAMGVTYKNIGGWKSVLADTINENFKDLDESRAKMLANVAMISSRGIDMVGWLRDAANHGVFSWKEDYDTIRWTEILDQLKESEMDALVERFQGIVKRLKNAGANAQNTQDVLDIINQYKDDTADFNSRLEDIKPEWNEHRSIVLGMLMDKNNIQDLRNLTEEQKRILAEDIHNLKDGLEGRSKWFRDWWEANMLNGLGIRPYVEPEATDDLEAWQKDLQAYFDAHGITFHVKAEDTWDTIREGLKKHKDELQKQVDADRPILIHFGLKIDNIPNDINSFLDEQGVTSPWLRNYYMQGFQRLSANSNEQESIKTAEATVPGLVASDKKKSTGGKSEDKEAKRLREEVKLVKDAYEWWKKYRELMSDDAALKEVQERYADFFREAGVRIDLNDIPNYRASLETMLAEAEKLYKQKGHHNSYMADVIKELKKAIEQVDYDDLKKRGDDWASALSHEVDMLMRKFEIFQSVLSSTGDEALAVRIASVGNDDIAAYRTGGQAEVLRRRLMVDSQRGETALSDQDFARVLELDDEGVEQYVKNLYGASDAVKGIVEQLKKWRDLQNNQTKSDIENYARALGQLVDKESQRVRIHREYNAVLEETQRLLRQGLISEEEARRREVIAGVNMETQGKQNESWYYNLYNNSQVMARDEFALAYRAELDNLDAQLDAGVITLTDYASKVSNLNKIASEFSSRGFLGIHGGVGAYLGNGVQGLLGYYQQRANKAWSEGNKEEAEKWQGRHDSLSKLQKGAEQVNHVFDELSKSANMLSDMFDALGMEGASNAMGDAGSVLGGIASGASSLSSLGPWGMAVGAAIGGITSIAQLHDKRRERQIEDLRRDVQKVDATLNVIKSLRERELGYDSGSVRKDLAQQYAQYNRKVVGIGNYTYNQKYGAAGVAMSEFYASGGGSGYEQEFEQLRKKRQDYINMYNAEEDKKKSSKEALLEYQEKIAELDEQIRYFSEDLAKELWSIDIKGWADQINDALMTAFENGENMMKAFDEAVKSIMQSITQEMLKIGIIEPMMERLRNRLFGYTDEQGNVHDGVVTTDEIASNPYAASEKMIAEVGDFLKPGGEGGNMAIAAQEYLTGVQRLLESKGLSLYNDNGSTLSSSVQGTSEETSGLLAGYVNAMRQDVSVNRLYLMQIAGTDLPDIKAMMTGGNTSLASIDSNVQALVRMMEMGDGALYREIVAINERWERFEHGLAKITIN